MVKHKFTTTRQYEKLQQKFCEVKRLYVVILKIKMFIKSKSGTTINIQLYLLHLMNDEFIHKFRKILIFSKLL